MSPGSLIDLFSAHARAVTALVPFCAAFLLRLVAGKNRVTGWLLAVSTAWLVLNLMLAPYSAAMRGDIESVRALFR